jgi:SWI/SNF-related matrix-associated actin-dependent regulator of chromatin subfamily B protein 1
LIPIHIDNEFEGQRYREYFSWNVNEPYLTPENFAKLISEENNFPLQIENEISGNIKRALQNYKPYVP